ncbi:MAG: D-alanine--D-alanine ligase A [Chloroflexi bacterium RBG_13_48_10]|nr:MAG: D-alanine--D-alanine ligase A [Chloroflexi bacterium RBG_13_48_10]
MELDQKLRVGVIFGGRSGEYEVSLMSARSVLGVLDPLRYDVIQIGISQEGAWLTGENVLDAMEKGQLEQLQIAALLPDPVWPGLYTIRKTASGNLLELLTSLDVVFPVLHGTFGEDGTLQGLLEMAGVAYVGAGVIGSSVGMDKGVFQSVMQANQIPVLETMVILRGDLAKHMDEIITCAEKMAPYPLFTKPANLGSSVGVCKCQNRADLLEGLMDAARYDRRILIQRGVNAREIEVSVLGNDAPEASVPGEIIPSREYYSYEAKYVDNASELLIPAPIPEAVSELARQLAVSAFKAIDCQGMARVDFLLDRDRNELFLNELNTIPGFTSISMYPKLWEACGLPYPKLVDRLIELAMQRKTEGQKTEYRYVR